MTLEQLREQWPNWVIDKPHHMEAREGGGGEVGYDSHWRTFFHPIDLQGSRWMKMAFGVSAEAVVQDIASRLPQLDKAYREEM